MENKHSVSDEFLQSLPIIHKKPDNEREEKYLREMCEYEFYNLEEPGLLNKFPYGNSKHKHVFTFMHGGKYRVPRFVADFLQSRTVPIHDWRPDGTGAMRKQKVGEKPRFQMRHVFS